MERECCSISAEAMLSLSEISTITRNSIIFLSKHTSRVLRCYNEKYPRILDFQYFQPHFRFKGNMDGDPKKVIEDFIKVEVRLHLVLVDTL